MQELVSNYNANPLAIPAEANPQFSYKYKPYETGSVTYSENRRLGTDAEIDEDSALATMIASEAVLARDWDTPEDDAAWADL